MSRITVAVLLGSLMGAGNAAPAHAEADAETLVNALNAVFGSRPHARAAHTKGVCVKGDFKPTADAAALTKAQQFAKPVAIIGRFSIGSGNPAQDDRVKVAHGFAIHYDLGGGKTTDMVLLSAPVFPAKTPDQFLSILQTIAPGPGGTPDKEKIGAFFKAHPELTHQAQWVESHPQPAGYTTASYFGIHAFTLTNASGATQIVKWKLVPRGGDKSLSEADAKAKPADFYTPELKTQLASGPADFDLLAYLGQPGDPVDDPTTDWPLEARKSVIMGKLAVTAVEPDATCDAGMFDPGNLSDGIAGPEKDAIFPMRSQAYAVSFARRAQ